MKKSIPAVHLDRDSHWNAKINGLLKMCFTVFPQRKQRSVCTLSKDTAGTEVRLQSMTTIYPSSGFDDYQFISCLM